MTANAKTTKTTVCSCDPIDGNTKTYYVWHCKSDEKQVIDKVDEVYVTGERVYFEKRSHETVSVPLADVFMVTCEICSAPPCS
jgi:hypothetical protein